MPEQQLPAPLTPARCVVSRRAALPIDIDAVWRARFYGTRSDAAFSAHIILMCAAWRQEPSGSLPDDDRSLAYYAGWGGNVRRWRRLRERALSGWTLCSDGRWYHPDVSRAACEAWLVSRLAAGRSALLRGRPLASIVCDLYAALERLDERQSPIVAKARAWLMRNEHRTFGCSASLTTRGGAELQ